MHLQHIAELKTSWQQFICPVMVGLLLLVTAGCLHLEQHITIRDDGTGFVAYHYSVAEDSFELLQQSRKTIQNWQTGRDRRLHWIFSRKTAEEYFNSADTTLKTYEQYSEDGRRHVQIRVAVENMRKSLAAGRFGEFDLDMDEAGVWHLKAQLSEDFDTQAMTAAQRQRLHELCNDLWLRLSITVPGAIQETTGQALTSNIVVWKMDREHADFLDMVPRISVSYK